MIKTKVFARHKIQFQSIYIYIAQYPNSYLNGLHNYILGKLSMFARL